MTRAPAFVATLTYNLLIAIYLAYLSIVENVGGVLLRPATALHSLMALLLIRMAVAFRSH